VHCTHGAFTFPMLKPDGDC